MDLKLTVMNGQHLLQGVDAVSVDSDIFSLGRGGDNSCVLPDPKLHISSKHCVIHRKNNEYHLTDISTNGVYVNGADEPIGRGRTAILKNSDRLSMGEYVFRVDLKSAVAMAASDQDIDALLTPDSEKDDQPEFADIIQTIAPDQESERPLDSVLGAKEMGANEAPVSFDDLMGKTPAAEEKASPADISELLKPASPEKDHFTPPAAPQPIEEPEADLNDQAFVKPTAAASTNAIPDNWMDMEAASVATPSASSKAPESTEASSAVSDALAQEMSRLSELEKAQEPDVDESEALLQPSPDEIYVPEADVHQAQEAIAQNAVVAESEAAHEATVERKPTIVDIAHALLDQKTEASEAPSPKSQPGMADLLNPDFVDDAKASSSAVDEAPTEPQADEPSTPSMDEMLSTAPEMAQEVESSENADLALGQPIESREEIKPQRMDVTGALLGDLPEPVSEKVIPAVAAAVVSAPKAEVKSVPQAQLQPEVSPEPVHSSAPVSSSTQTPASSDLFDLMLQEAGVPANLLDGRDKAAVAKEFGQMIQHFSQGIVETLATRSLVKSEFRLQQTMIRPTDNNPLKFSPSGTEALKIMMFADSSAYMSASRSVEEGFKDIQAHQLAMMSGIQAAFAHLLKRFEPEHLEGKFDRRPRHQKGILGRSKTDYWLEYRDFYEDICTMMEDEFQDLFSAEFGKAYEDQLRNLK